MEQTLADPKPRRELRVNTQQYKIQQIWKDLPKKQFNSEKNTEKKIKLKGELYTKISEIYEEKEGRPVKRSTIRRCVNSLINKAK